MTNDTKPQSSKMCFKVGKYFSEGEGYRRDMKKTLYEGVGESGVELVFQFFNNTLMECGILSKFEAIDKIDENCEKLKQMRPDLKRTIMEHYLYVIKPEIEAIINAERLQGEVINEPIISADDEAVIYENEGKVLSQ